MQQAGDSSLVAGYSALCRHSVGRRSRGDRLLQECGRSDARMPKAWDDTRVLLDRELARPGPSASRCAKTTPWSLSEVESPGAPVSRNDRLIINHGQNH